VLAVVLTWVYSAASMQGKAANASAATQAAEGENRGLMGFFRQGLLLRRGAGRTGQPQVD
jgi:hypothetical protein